MLQYQFRSPPEPSAMSIGLSLNAISFLNQVPRAEAQRIERALERLSINYDLLSQSHMRPIVGMTDKDGHALSSYKVARDVRAFIFVDQNVINVIDIIRKSQIDNLKSLPKAEVLGVLIPYSSTEIS